MKVGTWFSVFACGALGCLATPGPEGSGPKDDNQGHEQGVATDEPELSFVEGLTCAHNADCGRRSYCQYPNEQCDGTGTCQTRPRLCTHSHAPVCGCDGRSYSNACVAASAGMSVRHEGECDAGEPCGSVAICEKGLECCNASCGICVSPGGFCAQEICE